MKEIPSDIELKEKYQDILNNEKLDRINHWTEPNTDKPTDEQALKAKIFNNLDSYSQKIESAILSTPKNK